MIMDNSIGRDPPEHFRIKHLQMSGFQFPQCQFLLAKIRDDGAFQQSLIGTVGCVGQPSLGDLLQLEAVFLADLRVFFPVYPAKEHLQRADPQATIPVQLAVDDTGHAAFRIVRQALHQVIIALKVAVNSADLQFLHGVVLLNLSSIFLRIFGIPGGALLTFLI